MTRALRNRMWLCDRFRQHLGSADVVRQELARKKNIVVSLRTVEQTVAMLRRELAAAARLGGRRVEMGGLLGYSRRLHVRAYGEKQDSWFDGRESAFRAFGGVPREVLLDSQGADPAS